MSQVVTEHLELDCKNLLCPMPIIKISQAIKLVPVGGTVRMEATDPGYADKAAAFSGKVQDVTEFLATQGIRKPERELRARVTYQDPCHLAHGQNVRTQPRDLLRMIPGLELVETKDSDRCCGSAGIYNITHPDISMAVLDEKMENVRATRPEIIATANAGCMLQLQLGVRRAGLHAEVLHVVDLLDRAY